MLRHIVDPDDDLVAVGGVRLRLRHILPTARAAAPGAGRQAITAGTGVAGFVAHCRRAEVKEWLMALTKNLYRRINRSVNPPRLISTSRSTGRWNDQAGHDRKHLQCRTATGRCDGTAEPEFGGPSCGRDASVAAQAGQSRLASAAHRRQYL